MNNGKHVIGIIDDDESFRDSTSYFLERNGYEVKLFESGDDFVKQYETNVRLQLELDLVTLDILMPGLDGKSVLETIRTDDRFAGLKVVIMSSENTLENRVDLIEAGADDFTAKSDSVYELLARIKARLRDVAESASNSSGGSASGAARRTAVGGESGQGLEADESRKLEDVDEAILANGEPVDLTVSEYQIVKTLLRNLDHFVPKDDLSTIVFGDCLRGRARALDFHITRVRTKFAALNLPFNPTISTRRGFGVKLTYSPPDEGARNAA
jgi:DNA-binding response OmpR family regulator